MVNNDTPGLIPRTEVDGPAVPFGLPGVLVGIAEYDEGPTGCTALVFPDGVLAAMDIRGGAPGYTGDYPWLHGICMAGGSLLGVEAASGVAAEIYARRGYPTEWTGIPLVSGAIVFDFHGGDRQPVYPDRELGRAAAKAAVPGPVPIGPRGAGRSAGVGQGAAVRREGDVFVGVVTVVNALGSVVDRDGRVVYGGNRPAPDGAAGRTIDEELRLRVAAAQAPKPGNTTLTVVATNARLDSRSLTQVGRQVHASMARAIQPFHTLDDGDVLWTVTTGRGPEIWPTALGIIASETAWDAVLSAAT